MQKFTPAGIFCAAASYLEGTPLPGALPPPPFMNVLILAWASWFAAFLLPSPTAEVDYYGQLVPVTYDAAALHHDGLTVDERGIDAYLTSVVAEDWSSVIAPLRERRDAWRLNDFLYARLVDATVARIAEHLPDNERRVITAHLLSLDGYDMRLCYDSSEVYVYARTDEPLFEVPIITESERRFVNLTSALRPRDGVTRSLKFHPRRLGPEDARALSFDLRTLPELPRRLSERVYEFSYRGQRLKLHAACDLSVVAWMRDYPIIEEGKYVETPLTSATAERLHAELRPLLAGKTEREQLELLAAFTRGAFVYKEDSRGYGASKPMIADEVLHYPVSDCEDRSALYFSLVRDLLDLPVVAIAYDDHLSVAVSSPALDGGARPFRHEGRTYHVCDPTGPSTSHEIGDPPYGYARRRFEVVAAYAPTRA